MVYNGPGHNGTKSDIYAALKRAEIKPLKRAEIKPTLQKVIIKHYSRYSFIITIITIITHTLTPTNKTPPKGE